MSIASLHEKLTSGRGAVGSGSPPPSDARQTGAGDRLYRIFWLSHFYAGIIISLPLIVVAATGALWIFKDELEGVLHPGVMYVEPAVERATYEQQLAAARAAAGPAYQIGTMQLFMNPKRATELAMGGQKFQFG